MKRILFVMMALLMTGGILMAQNRKDIRNMTDREWVDHMTNEMVRDYNLDANQRERLDRLNDEMRPKMDRTITEYQRGNLTARERDNLENEMRNHRNDYDNRVRQILNDNQYDRYKNSKTERESMNQLRREIRENR